MRILVLDLDTLRPDHLGCYGYRRDTSPHIDGIAARGVRFENYFCSDGPCLPSRAALVSGRFGIHNGVVNHGGAGADMRNDPASRGFRSAFHEQSLWALFREQGLWTASVSTFAERHSAWWFNAGFNEMVNVGYGGMESAERVTPHALDWISKNAAKDHWLLHVNYWDPHTPYRAPADFGNPFAKDPLPPWHTPEVLERHNRLPGGHGSREVSMFNNKESLNPDGTKCWPRHVGEITSMDDYRRMIDGYDCGIRYMDGHIGQLLDALREQEVFEDLAIIVTSDHGENLGELNCYGEHGTADQITHRIPMIVSWPGCRKGTMDTGLHYNLDLAPTVAELFGVPAKPLWDGQSYAASLKERADTGHDHLVLSQCCHGAMRSVRFRDDEGEWIWIRVYHDFFHLYPREMLFNLSRDPHEQHDLADREQARCDRAAHLLLNWHDDMMCPGPGRGETDPLVTVLAEGGPFHSRGQLPAYCAFLEKTERGTLVPELKERHSL